MGYDLKYSGSNTCNLSSVDAFKTVNEYIYQEYFTLSQNNFDDPWTNGFKIRDEAPIQIKDNGSADFCWDTGIYTYEKIMKTNSNPAMIYLQEQIKKQSYTTYIFIQIF